jgi:hypothetical protein
MPRVVRQEIAGDDVQAAITGEPDERHLEPRTAEDQDSPAHRRRTMGANAPGAARAAAGGATAAAAPP